jgi:hypothetical protein
MTESSLDAIVECPTCGQPVRQIVLESIESERDLRAREALQEVARLEHDVDAEGALPWDELPDGAHQHSERFRKVSNRYPNVVARAYGRDLERAAGDSDEQVAATVAAWEREQGLEPND